MKISICIPQYNRIELLIRSLKQIELQDYENIEIVVSDDCSTDTTTEEILNLKETYRYPLVYFRFDKNQGYDRNYRKCIELGSGDYCLVIGNDDTIYENTSISTLVNFLIANNLPDIGYCNFIEEKGQDNTVQRVLESQVHGSGVEVAIKHANGFSFVGGLIYKKSAFESFNTSKHDGSIYSQMYLGLLMIAKGCTLFTIKEPLVLKDILYSDGSFRWSAYRDGLPKSWKEYRDFKSGLLSVMNVLISACMDAEVKDQSFIFKIMKRMYSVTYPYWIIQYIHYGSYAASWSLIKEMKPSKNEFFSKMSSFQQVKIRLLFLIFSIFALCMPYQLFTSLQKKLHKMVRK